MNKVVVTGIGIVSPYGTDLDEFWNALKNGQGAIQSWQYPGVDGFPVQYGAPVDVEKLRGAYESYFETSKSVERRVIFAQIAAALAVQDSKIDSSATSQTLGVCVCSGVADADNETMAALMQIDAQNPVAELVEKRDEVVSRLGGFRSSNDALASRLANEYAVNGPVINLTGACAGATQSIGVGMKAIRRNEADIMIVGGADSVFNLRTMSALVSLGATSTSVRHGEQLCRPFDENRSGLVAGEGGAVLILESEQSAKARGAKIYCEVTGYGSSLDAYKVTAPHEDGLGAIASMESALADANLSHDLIGHVNAHGTSTPLNDVIESKAIEAVFADHANDIIVSSTKSMIGHWIAAAGAPEAIATILALREQCVPPTINLEKPDENCRLNYATELREKPMQYALSNSFGFGGINASVIFGVYQDVK